MIHEDRLSLYRRIYRMHKSKFNPIEISTVIGLPLNTIKNILKILNNSNNPPSDNPNTLLEPEQTSIPYFIPVKYSKYTLLDVGGKLNHQFLKDIKEVFSNIINTNDIQLLVLKLTNANNIDSSAIGAIVWLSMELTKKGKKIVLYDPSKEIDELFTELGIYEKISVFGTKSALESYIAKQELFQRKKSRNTGTGFFKI